MEHVPGQIDIYEAIEIASLDALVEDGWDVADKHHFGSRDNLLVPDEDNE